MDSGWLCQCRFVTGKKKKKKNIYIYIYIYTHISIYTYIYIYNSGEEWGKDDGGQVAYEKTLHLLLNFAVNLKLL